MKLNLKHFFFILIAFILSLFAINILVSNNKIVKTVENITNLSLKKTLGIKIERQNFKGETFIIKADELEENKNKKQIEFRNSVTTLKANDSITKIFAGLAIIKNDYQDFNFFNKVEIINYKKQFFLKTEALNGQFKKGTMFTKKNVNIKIRNTSINGKGLKLLNHGEYIKIYGKAKLTTE